MDRGYVKLWRKITDSPCFKNEGLLKVWIWCLSKASHKERVVQIQTGRGFASIQIQPGQFVFGRKIAAAELDMDESTVYKRMQKLKTIGNCNIQSNTHCSVISIINWDIYQSENDNGNRQGNTQVTGKEQASNTDKNVKNVKNNKTPLPEWLDSSLWKDFCDHRKKLRKPMTPRAEQILIKKLESLKDEGYNPKHLIVTAIERGWQSVFAPNQ